MYLPGARIDFDLLAGLDEQGRLHVMPVSMVTAFWTLFAESPRIPSGASDTFSTTLDGNSIETALSSTKVTVTGAFSTR